MTPKQWNSTQRRARKRRSHKKRWTPAIGFGAAALMISMAMAEDAANTISGESSAIHPEVVVQGDKGYNRKKVSSPKYTEPLRNIPQTITIIPKEVMRDQNATSLRQALQNVPGISMQAGEGGVPAGDNLTIRGFNARTDFYIDGMRDYGGYSRDTFNIETIEVSKGPSSTTSGRGSTGGSINQISKYPGLENFNDASLGMGTDEYKRGTIDVNHVTNEEKGTAVRINALWHGNDTPRRNAVENERWGFAPSIAFGLATPTRLTLGYYKLVQDNTPDYGIPFVPETNNALPDFRGRPAPVDLANFYGLKARDYEKIDTEVLTAKFEHDFNDSLKIDNTTVVGDNYRDSAITAPRFVSNSTTTINRNFQSRDQKDTIVANQTDLTSNFNTFGIDHTLVVGAELAREEQHNFLRNATNAPTANLYDPNPYDPYPNGRIVRNGTDVKAIAETKALYAFDSMKLGEYFEIPLGGRWESFGVDLTSNTVGRTPVSFERVDKMFSGRAAIVLKPSDKGSFYAGYGTSFNPSAEGLTSGFTAALANVEPEKTKTFEVGTKWDLVDRRLSMNAAIFRTEKTNARTPGVNPGDPPTVLEGEQKVDGAELGFTGNINNAWQIFTGYTFLESEIEKSNTPAEVGKEISNTPENSFNVWTTYEFPTRLNIGAGAQYTGKRYANNTNTREVGSYLIYDAMMSYPVNDDVTLRLNVTNVTNEEYYDRLGGGHLIPGVGRAATLSTDIRFGAPKSEPEPTRVLEPQTPQSQGQPEQPPVPTTEKPY